MENPDSVTSDAVIQEIQRIDPRVLQLAVANVRAEQWKEYANRDKGEQTAVQEAPAEIQG